jgi:hypothetical protein
MGAQQLTESRAIASLRALAQLALGGELRAIR